ncbi:hypothetical protein F511_40790 [Dorcoceras hygrometricum]|uniref:Uncharacterized protein n=1 Tax=Dorcoceras hygrometricum TaxID=472368 RepID=A0A2Z7D2J8_9LAMI|nr:hypothetical protein F511_40790 [Dorcoceras hygrometricum]
MGNSSAYISAIVGSRSIESLTIKKTVLLTSFHLIVFNGNRSAYERQLDFQTKIAADILSLSTQVSDIADYIRSGDAKKGEIGSSSRRPPLFVWNAAPYPLRTTKVKVVQAMDVL